jgi:hypothetical protein
VACPAPMARLILAEASNKKCLQRGYLRNKEATILSK